MCLVDSQIFALSVFRDLSRFAYSPILGLTTSHMSAFPASPLLSVLRSLCRRKIPCNGTIGNTKNREAERRKEKNNTKAGKRGNGSNENVEKGKTTKEKNEKGKNRKKRKGRKREKDEKEKRREKISVKRSLRPAKLTCEI